MTYASLLMHLQPERSTMPLLSAAGRFADRCAAHVIGIAVCQPLTQRAGVASIESR